MASLRTESVTMDDFEDVLRLRIAAMRESLVELGRFDPRRARMRLADSFEPEQSAWLYDGEMAVGYWMVREVGDNLVLEHLYIHPRFQSRGYGGAAMAMLLERADREGKDVHVTALKKSRANAFYQRHGFILVDDEELYDNHYLRKASKG